MTAAAATRTHCPYCAFQCGMQLDATAARGDASFPVNRGQLCIKGFNAGALLESRERLLQPLVRDVRRMLRRHHDGFHPHRLPLDVPDADLRLAVRPEVRQLP